MVERVCPKCNIPILSEKSLFCHICGTSLASKKPPENEIVKASQNETQIIGNNFLNSTGFAEAFDSPAVPVHFSFTHSKVSQNTETTKEIVSTNSEPESWVEIQEDQSPSENDQILHSTDQNGPPVGQVTNVVIQQQSQKETDKGFSNDSTVMPNKLDTHSPPDVAQLSTVSNSSTSLSSTTNLENVDITEFSKIYPSVEDIANDTADSNGNNSSSVEIIQYGDPLAYYGQSVISNHENSNLSTTKPVESENASANRSEISIVLTHSGLLSSSVQQQNYTDHPEIKPKPTINSQLKSNVQSVDSGSERKSGPKNATRTTASENPLTSTSDYKSVDEFKILGDNNKRQEMDVEIGVDVANKVIDNQPTSRHTSRSGNTEEKIDLGLNRFADRRCRTVRFAILVPQDFDFDPRLFQIYIIFGQQILGGFNELYYPLRIIGRIDEQYFVMSVNVFIPNEIDATDYKYIKFHKYTGNCIWEHLHYSNNPEADRHLRFLHDSPQEVYRFDGCIQPEKIDPKARPLLKLAKDAFKNIFNAPKLSPVLKKVNSDSQIAFNYFMPSWSLQNGFYILYDLEHSRYHLQQRLTVDKTVEIIEEVMHCFTVMFYSDYNHVEKDYYWNCVQNWFEETLHIVSVNFAKLNSIERIEAGCVLCHVSHIIRHSARRVISEDRLLSILYMFGYSIDNPVAVFQKDALSKIRTFDIKNRLHWVISTIEHVPESLVAIPLFNSLIGNNERSKDVNDIHWWLATNKLSDKTPCANIDWERLNAVLIKYAHYSTVDKYFARYLLIKYCFDFSDVIKVRDFCTSNDMLAWCSYRAMHNEWIVKGPHCRRLTELLQIVRDKLNVVENSEQHKELMETVSKFGVTLLNNGRHVLKENIQFLMTFLDIVGLLAKAQYPDNFNELTVLLSILKKLFFQNKDCFMLNQLANESDWNRFAECLKWKGNTADERVLEIWLNTIIPCIEQMSNDNTSYYRLLEIFCLDDFETFPKCIQDKIEMLAVEKVEHFLRDKTDGKKLWDKIRNTKRISDLLSLVYVRLWPKENTSDVDILMHIAKSPFLCRYFDKSYMDNVKLSKDCDNLLSKTKLSVINFKKSCSDGKISLNELKHLSCDKETFLDVLELISRKRDDDFRNTMFPSLFTVMKDFEKHQSDLRKLRPFISIVKIDESKLLSKVLSYELNVVLICDIADKRSDGSFVFTWSLSADLLEALDKLHKVNENQIFLYYWHSRRKSLKEQIALSEFLDLIYLVVVEQIRECVEMLKDTDISVQELEVVLERLSNNHPAMYFAKEIRFLCANLLEISDDWVNEFDEKLMLYEQLKKNSITNKVFCSLVAKLGLTNAHAELKKISSFVNEKDKADLKLSDLSRDLIESAVILSSLSPDQLSCLSAADDYFDLIKWAREKNERDLPKFVDIAYSNVGESDADYAMITDFNNVIVGFNCLIYNVPISCDLRTFFAQLHRLWETLERNQNLAKQLEQSYHNRYKLEALWQAAGDLQKSSLDEIERINLIGIYRIGDINNKVTKKTTDNCIELELPNENETSEIVNMTKLRDLHSRVMLMGTRMEKSQTSKQEIDHFALVFDAVTRLASLYVQHFEAGNILFTEWRCLLDNNINSDLQATCYVSTSRSLISGEKDANLTVLEQIDALCTFFETSLHQWNEYIEKLRHQFPALNYFTNKQVEYLRKSLACIGRKFDPKAALMLLVLNNISHDDLINIVSTCTYDSNNDKTELEEFSDDEKDFILSLTAHGYSLKLSILAAKQVQFESVEAAKTWAVDNVEADGSEANQLAMTRDISFTNQLSEMVKILETHTENLLAHKLELLWSKHLSANESASYTEFVGVRHLGKILTEISKLSSFDMELHFHGVEQSKPSLFVVPNVDMYRFVLSLYTHVGGSLCLPTFETVLMCNEDTSAESVYLFIQRLASSNGKKFYSIVAVDQLKTDVSAVLEIIIEDLLKSGQKFYLALIADESNFNPNKFFTRYSAKYKNLEDWMETKEFIHKHLLRTNHKELPNIATLPAEFCLSYFTAAFFTSVGYGHGKSQAVSVQKEAFPDATIVKIPIHDNHFNCDELYDLLAKDCLVDPHSVSQRIIHIDILNHKTNGVDKMLFQLLILGGFTTTMGNVWRLLKTDSYAIEMTSLPNRLLSMQLDITDLPEGNNFRFLLPTCLCHSPNVSYKLAIGDLELNVHTANRSLNENWTNEDATQVCYQYLSSASQNNHAACIAPDKILSVLLEHCGIRDPSWAELRYFVTFLYRQLTACEQSSFCLDIVKADLPGFTDFAVKFLIQMSRDFSTRSLEISEDVGSLIKDRLTEVEAYQIKQKQKWEYKAHPYIFLNEDQKTFSFFGCNLNNQGDLIDPLSEEIIENGARIATPQLVKVLKINKVDDLRQKFDNKTRQEKIEKICMVFGVSPVNNDPDPSYEITSDCALKILAIKMRFRCGIPVVIMGATGCGKTKLVEYMSLLERNGHLQKLKESGRLPNLPVPQNLILVRVHGGTTKEQIEVAVEEAMELAHYNAANFYNLSTILMFDEANSTPYVSLIKEIMCDGTVNGRPLRFTENCLNIVAAVNPYRKHSDDMIKNLENSGLGYHISATNVTEKFGDIPLRQLVYRVNPLPASMLPLVWDFGTLTSKSESLYIKQMVKRCVTISKIEFLNINVEEVINVLSVLLAETQNWMHQQTDEAGFVSLRNVERVLRVIQWFYSNGDLLFKNNTGSKLALSILMAVSVCYRCSIQAKREEFDDFVGKHFVGPIALPNEFVIVDEITKCQETLLKDIELPANIAKNEALRENLFMMTLCVELRIPLFLIGKPGSSKSLAKTVVSENMCGLSSKSEIFKTLKQAVLVSFQCSPLATADGVETIFRQCARHQRSQNLNDYVAAAVFDEIGLAEDSPKLPLKALHGLLEVGCSIDGEELTSAHCVAFVGISNWALDPAKMNRGIFVTRVDPTHRELLETAERICNKDGINSVYNLVDELIKPLTTAYMEVYESQQRLFFGLRDFYSLMKMIYEVADDNKKRPKYRQIMNAVRHNFSGQKDNTAYHIFDAKIAPLYQMNTLENVSYPATMLIEENLNQSHMKYHISRYLLILNDNYAAMRLLKQVPALSSAEIIFGSSFPQDLEYTQVCRDINKIKVCMDKGRPVILLNLEQLYESLYDLLNQAFIQLADENFVDLGLGTHRLKCHVHKSFRLVVVAERTDVLNRFPLALLNRLEKHFVTSMDNATLFQRNAVDKIKDWAELFAKIKYSNSSRELEPADIFIGYHVDTPTAIVEELCATKEYGITGLQAMMEIFQKAKQVLLQSATPDAIVRLRYTELHEEADYLWNLYFKQQAHDSFFEYLVQNVTFNGNGHPFNQITTHSQLFSLSDNSKLANILNLQVDQVTIVTLQIYNTQQDFHKRITQIFKIANGNPHLLVVQCLAGDQNEKLIACSRYILENVVKSEEFQGNKIQICFLISLPRKSGGCFTGFPNFGWQCYHIDELAPEENDIIDFNQLTEKSIADLMNDFTHNIGSINFFDHIIKESLQLATSYIRDDSDRKLERLDLLQNLWKDNDEFRQCIFAWLQKLLVEQQQNETWRRANDWLFMEATKTSSILEHRTYKHALYKSIENAIVPLLGGLVSVIDRGNNLNLLVSNGEDLWKSKMWLKLFLDQTFLDLHYNSDVFVQKDSEGRSVARQEFVISSHVAKFQINVPFFWVIKEKMDIILKDFDKTSTDIAQCEEQCLEVLKNTEWGSVTLNLPSTFTPAYVHDFVLSIYNVEDNSTLSQLLMAWIAESSGLERLEQGSTPVLLCPITHRILSVHMQIFIDIAKAYPEIIPLLDNTEIAKYHFTLDLLAVMQLVNILNKYVDDIDPKGNLITDVPKKNRAKFVSLVRSSCSLVKRVFDKYEQTEYLHNSVKQLLNDLQKSWFAAELCASFLHETSVIRLPLHVKGLWNDNQGEKAIKGINCEEFWKRLETSMKWWTQQLMLHYFKSTKCVNPRCKALASFSPVVLPCMHVMHKKCFVEMFETLQVKSCPADDCNNKDLPENFAEVADNTLRQKREQYLSDRNSIMNFFMGMIYELFNGTSPPSVKVLEVLLSYITHKYDSNRLGSQDVSPFPDEDAIDVNPVIRSFLLQLILNQNLSLVLGHIDVYLNNGRLLLNSDQFVMKDFIWMCISCTEDSLYGKFVQNFKSDEDDFSAINFIQQNVPNKIACKDLFKMTSEDIERLAKCRFILSVFVDLIVKYVNDLEETKLISLNDSIRHILTGEEAHKESKMFLLKIICLRHGVEFARQLKSNEMLNWIVSGVTLEANDSPDPFVLYGDVYCSIKTALSEAAFVKNGAIFQQKLREIANLDKELGSALICMTVQQLIKTNGLDMDQNNWMKTLSPSIHSGLLQGVFEKFLSPNYWTSLTDATNNHLLATFACHLLSAINYLPASGVVAFFHTILSRPKDAQGLLFPAMIDDYFDQTLFNTVQQALFVVNRSQPTINTCPNGHPYAITECGQAMETGVCPTCQTQIGGANHRLLDSNKRLDKTDNKIIYGHCLGDVSQLGSVVLPLRNLDPLNVTVTRFLIHTIMWLSSMDHPDDVSSLVTPKVSAEQIQDFLLNHMKRNLNILSRLLFVSTEDVIILMHKLLTDWVTLKRGCQNNSVYDFTVTSSRDQWETDFRTTVLEPVLPNSAVLIENANTLLAETGTQNSFYAEIYNNNLQAGNWLGLFWSYRPSIKFDYLLNSVMSQLDAENRNDKRFLIMKTFFKKIVYLDSCQYLSDVIKLHKEVYSQFGGLVSLNEIKKLTIQEYLESRQPSERETLLPLIRSFFTALKTVEPKLDKLKFSSKFVENSKSSNAETIVERAIYVEKCMVPNLSDPLSNSITSILPLAYGQGLYGQGLCSCALVFLLIKEQNEFVEACAKIQEGSDNVKLGYKKLDSESISQLINFDLYRDIYPLLLLHRNFAYTSESKTESYFDLSRLQCRLERFYNSNCTTLLQYCIPLLKTRESFLLDCLQRLRVSGQLELSTIKQQEILQVLVNKPFETRVLLDASENLLRFSVSIGRRDDSVIALMQKICSKSLTDLSSLRRNILHDLSLAHLPSLWQLIAFHSKYLRMSNREDPFLEISDQFKTPLTMDEEERLAANISQLNVLQFLLEFTEFLLLHLAFGASGVERLRANQSGLSNPIICDEDIKTYFLYSQEYSQRTDIELDSCLLMKHAVAIWKFAVKRFAQTRRVI